MILKRDVYSIFRPSKKYASAGDIVKLIKQVLIVEDKDGERFSVSSDDILQEGELIERPVMPLNNRKNKPTQQSLF